MGDTDHYELVGTEIILIGQQNVNAPRLKVEEIQSWQQVFYCVGVWSIVVICHEGQQLECDDPSGKLLALLQKMVPEKETPWKAT